MKSLECDLITKELWKFCSSRGMWVSATYIPGRTNVIADRMSREFNDQTEWMLNPAVFFQIIEKLKFFPMIDIFASRLNHQLDKYISWLPDPGSVSVDVFSISWSNIIFYAYPPISMIGAAITKHFAGSCHRDHDHSLLDNPILVPNNNDFASQRTHNFPTNKNSNHIAVQSRSQTPSDPKNTALCSTLIRRCITNCQFSVEVSQIILGSWRETTRGKYNSVLRRWESYCTGINENALRPSVLQFLLLMYEGGCQYNGSVLHVVLLLQLLIYLDIRRS